MTVTTPPSALRQAATRERALGNTAYAASLDAEAAANNMPWLVGAPAQIAADLALAASDTAQSQVITLHGMDGAAASGGY